MRTTSAGSPALRQFNIGPGSIAWSPWSSWAGTRKPNAKPRAIRRGASPTEQAALFDAVRLLDQCAATAESDLRQRRFGLVLKLIVEPLVLCDRRENEPRSAKRAGDAVHPGTCSSPAPTAKPAGPSPHGAAVLNRPTIGSSATWETPTIGSKPTRSTSTSSACG